MQRLAYAIARKCFYAARPPMKPDVVRAVGATSFEADGMTQKERVEAIFAEAQRIRRLPVEPFQLQPPNPLGLGEDGFDPLFLRHAVCLEGRGSHGTHHVRLHGRSGGIETLPGDGVGESLHLEPNTSGRWRRRVFAFGADYLPRYSPRCCSTTWRAARIV